jgi:transketolase
MLYAFRDSIYELARKDKRIAIICSDQEIGLEHMQKEMPGQYFMEGIAEANIIGMAAGMAADGFIPYIVGHGSFLTRRVYEQIYVDACLQENPIRIIGIGTGLAAAHLGPTHTLTEDLAFMRAMPGMTVIVPCDADEVKRIIPQTANWKLPVYVRLARYGKPVVSRPEHGFEIGKAVLLQQAKSDSKNVLLIANGAMTARAIAAAEQLAMERIAASVLHIHTVKPLDEKAITEHAKKAKFIIIIEEHTRIGGLGSACLEVLADNLAPSEMPLVCRLGLPDIFIHDYGTQESLLEKYGLETHHIVKKAKELATMI